MKEEETKIMEIKREDEMDFINQLVIRVILSNKVISSNPQLEQLRLSGNTEEFSKLYGELMKIFS